MKNFLALCTLLLGLSLVHGLINPVLPGWNPDPSLLRVGGDYFLATSTFEYFPGVPIYHSKDLVNWELIGHALNRPSQLTLFGTPSDAGVWAPTLRYHNGTFYLATTTRYVYTAELRLFPRSFYVSTTDIFSDYWSDPVYFDSLGYDVDLFWDTNGDVYNTWSGINNAKDKIYGIYQSKIDLSTGTSLTPPQHIFNGTLPNNSSARPEGPHIYLINGTYYLLIAEGGTDVHHRSTIQRGPSPSGPWENNPANPILFNGANLNNDVQNTGHADMVEGPDGRWWGSALGVIPQKGNFSHIQLGRQTFLFPITWENGWPIFNGGQPLTQHIPDVLPDVSPIKTYFNDFSFPGASSIQSFDPPGSPSLDETFYTLRTPQKPFHSLTARPGYLRVYGNSYTVGDRDTPALLLRKQQAYTEEFEVLLDGFIPQVIEGGQGREEAGITVLYSDFLHQDIAVTTPKFNGTGNASINGTVGRMVITRTIVQAQQVGPWTLGSDNNTIITEVTHPIGDSGPIRLFIKASPSLYTLGFVASEEGEELGDANVTWTGSADASTLSLPVAGGFFFKGASFGVYNTGIGRPSFTPADFKYWKQTFPG